VAVYRAVPALDPAPRKRLRRRSGGRIAAPEQRTPDDGHEAPQVLPGHQRFLLGVVIAVVALSVAVATVGVVFLLRDDDTGDRAERRAEPRIVSLQELREFAGSLPHPLYWAGTFPGFKLELTTSANGNIYVRYLPKDVAIGDRRPLFTTIGTYPMRNAFAALKKAGRQEGTVETPAAGGGIALSRRTRPSVYLAYPGAEVLVEIYARGQGRAQELLQSGRVGPVR
jgi:hypothetical protein